MIEDELKTANSLKEGLEEVGYEVKIANDGNTAIDLVNRHDFDLLIMDVILPAMNGFDICRKLREQNHTMPVIMLTALGMTADKLRGFDAGSDDYIVKPFEFEELLARVRVALSRRQKTMPLNKLRFADLEMDLDTMEVRRGGKSITLTAKEFSLLSHFLRNPNKILSKDEIAEKVWNLNFDTGTNFVEVYVSYLRNKVDKGFDKKLIHTRKGMGYILKEAS